MRMIRHVPIWIACLIALASAPLTQVFAQQDATPESEEPAVVRDVLGSDTPDEAPGELLELSRYTIPAGFVLPAHTHPGVQMATVVSGTLTYYVIANGDLPITRADGTQKTAIPGDTVVFTVGDSWVEAEGMEHSAENLTDEPVILLSTSLFENGEPTSELVEATPAP